MWGSFLNCQSIAIKINKVVIEKMIIKRKDIRIITTEYDITNTGIMNMKMSQSSDTMNFFLSGLPFHIIFSSGSKILSKPVN